MAAVEKQMSDVIMGALPREGWRKAMFKAPLYAYRIGMERTLPGSFAVLTTRGRKSGQPRHTMIEHAYNDGVIYVTSGWEDRSHWVKNLLADPHVTVQPVHGKPQYGMALRVQDDADLQNVFNTMQHSPMWEPWLEALDVKPDIDDFLANKERLWVFKITTGGEQVLPPLEQNLRWVTWLLAGFIALVVLGRLRK